MQESILPEISPDYVTSHWLSFNGVKPVQGDPGTEAQFVATHTCLVTITNHLANVAGPWFAATPQDIEDAYSQFIEWSHRYNETSRDTGEGLLTTDISLHHLLALSTRRLNALEEFGGEGREEYPLFLHFHTIIRTAVEDSAPEDF
jgi:hypothetical protein